MSGSILGDTGTILNLYQQAATATSNAALYDEEAAMERRAAARRVNSPFMLLRPRMFPEGDQWCALYGENLQDGVAGFGRSPEEAEAAFNLAWRAKR